MFMMEDMESSTSNSSAKKDLALKAVRNRMLVSLRGGGGELGNLKP
jgi:hypothetical protein